jgi:hypothetical protein
MAPDYAQRRRVALAVAITAIAAPAAFLFDRGGDEPEQVVTTAVGSVVPGSGITEGAAGTTAPPDASEAVEPSGTDPMGTAPAAYLEPSGSVAPEEPATIAIPRLPEAVEGLATFTRSIGAVTSCQVKASIGAPFGAAVTVTNLDNSRTVQCIFDVGGATPDHEIVLNADAFAQIADLTDAPVPVQLTW